MKKRRNEQLYLMKLQETSIAKSLLYSRKIFTSYRYLPPARVKIHLKGSLDVIPWALKDL